MNTDTISTTFAAKRHYRTRTSQQKLDAMTDLNTPVSIPPSPGCEHSVAIRLTTANFGSLKTLRVRTLGDEIEKQVAATNDRPTTDAIRMANAIMLERILGTGQFRSPAALAERLGINRSVFSKLLSLLNLPPAEIERRLFETY